MLKVLINAYACRPDSGSEAGAAWKWITGLAEYHELYVITEGEWRKEIDEVLPVTPYGDRIHFFYNPVSERVRKMCWNQGDYRFYFHYAKWQRKTLKLAQAIMREVHIDLIHQLNMIGFREPGYLWKLKGPAFVWGPVGGMSLVPMQYLEDAPIRLRFKYYAKNAITKLQYRYHTRVRNAIRRANTIIAANQDSYHVLSRLCAGKKISLINETGCSTDSFTLSHKDNKAHFNILFVGRFIPTKMLDLCLKTIASIRELEGLKLHIVGKAFSDLETEKLHKMAHSLELDDVVEWHGWLSHEEVQTLMRSSDVFFFPSIVEGTPHVVLESIANGLPVVCFDICGQADAVDDTVGCKIALSNPKQSIQDFSKVLKSLYYDRALLQRLSDNCNARKKELSWENKIRKALALYQES